MPNLGPRSARFLLALCLLAGLLLIACPTSEESGHVLSLQIDKDNDSLLTFETVVVKVYRLDSTDSQTVFSGKLTDAKQVQGLPLDPKIGSQYFVTITGYRSGKIAMQKEITVLGANNFQSKDIPIHTDKPETTVIEPAIPEILLSSPDAHINEGDTLRITIHVKNRFTDPSTLTLKDSPSGASLDTTGRSVKDTVFQWVPDFSQGKADPYTITFVYSMGTRKVERSISISVKNVNRAPKLIPIADKKVKEGEHLAFYVEASDVDKDSLTFSATNLPEGSSFSGTAFDWTPKAGQAGNYSVRFKVFDGQDSDLVVAFITVGNPVPPPELLVRITSPGQDTVINYSPITVFYTVNGTLLQRKFPLKDGKTKLFVDTTIDGRTAFDTVTVTLDTVPPGRPTVLAASPVNTRTPSWRWKSGGGAGSGKFRIKLDDGNLENTATTTDTSYSPATDLSIGTHTLYVSERDLAGNWSVYGSASVRIDTLPPSAPAVSCDAGSLTNNPKPRWTWSSGGQGDAGLFQAKLDSPDFSQTDSVGKGKSFLPSSNLSDGPHTLYVREQDSAGNWSKAGSAMVKVDVTPPGAPILLANPYSPLNGRYPSWDWISGGGGIAKYRIRVDNPDLSSASEVGVTNYLSPTALEEGPHTLYVQERDSAGNWSASGSREIVVALRGPAGPAGFSQARALDVSLAMTKDNTPVVAFRDAWNDYKATVMRLNGASWQNVGNAGFSTGNVFGVSLALDGSGTPYVAYQDGDSGFRATVMKYSGSNWATVGPQGFSHRDANDLKIGKLKNGRPFVTLRDSAERGSALQFNGTAWANLGSTDFPFLHIDGITQTVSPSGTPFVVFIDASKEKKLTCMKFNGTEWETVGNAGFTPWPSDQLSIAVDGNDIPYVALSGPTVMKLKGATWEIVGNDKISSEISQRITIAVDKNGLPYIAFSEGLNSKLSVMRFNTPSWQYLGEPEFSIGGAEYISIAISSWGVPYIGFSDLGRSGNATVMKTSFDP